MAKATAHKKKASVYYSNGYHDGKSFVHTKCQPVFTKRERRGEVTPQV